MKINSPMLAETPVTQRSPCYSAVSTSLTNPLPDCSCHLPHPLPHSLNQFFSSLTGQTLYQAAPLETNTSLLLRFAAESSRELIPQCLEEAEQQAEECGDVPPPLQIFISTPFCLFLFSLYLYPLSAPFLNSLSSPFPHFP